MRRVCGALLLSLLPGRLASLPGPPPSPESVLGFRVGEDRRLADWRQIADYFRRLDDASDRVRVEDVGRTTEGRPFLVVTITSGANMARLETVRRGNARLADPRGLSPVEAEGLVTSGKVVVALHHGIHSTEVAASQTAMETAYRLATAEDPASLEVLDNVVILMIPSHNPDGTAKVVEWYRKTVGTPYEGGAIPFLYHPYAGHDNNRDWYAFTLAESRLTVQYVYDRWHPQIVHDLHQMGSKGARMFVPPYIDPWEPNVDPALITATNALGTHVAAQLTSEGKPGVLVQGIFDAWTPGRAYPHTHGGVRLLSECASARMATPLEVRFEDLEAGPGYDAKRASWNFPLPWQGGWWRLRDVVEYQLAASRSILEHAARHRGFWLRTFLAVNRRAVERTHPYAFVLSSRQRDPYATARLLEILRTGGVEVHRARSAFAVEGQTLAAGSHVVLMAQPAGGFAKTVLESQHYPDRKGQRPYDVTAHTLPLLMGVDVLEARAPFDAELEKLDTAQVPPGSVDRRGRFLALGHKTGDLLALARLLEAGVPVRWTLAPVAHASGTFPAGALLVPRSAARKVEVLARELGVSAAAISTSPPHLVLRRPRVGLYRSWVANMDEGWTRLVFEQQMQVRYETLHDKDIRAGRLRARFDAIVLPDQAQRAMLQGHGADAVPPEFSGGLGKAGARALRSFVVEGGTLIALDSAARFALEELGLPVSDTATPQADPAGARADDFFIPGSILETSLTSDAPLGHGLEAAVPVWFESSPAFDVREGEVILRYPDKDLLLSGFAQGGEQLRGKAALVSVPLGRGKVVLFGFRPQYRAQSWGTYIPFLNALYLSAASHSR